MISDNTGHDNLCECYLYLSWSMVDSDGSFGCLSVLPSVFLDISFGKEVITIISFQ